MRRRSQATRPLYRRLAARRPGEGRPDPLRDALGRRARPGRPTVTVGALDLRMERMEQELQETRTRVNALFFAVLGVGLGDLIGRLVVAA